MDDATLRTRLQDLREGHGGDASRGASAFTESARWRDNVGQDWLEGRDAIAANFAVVATGQAQWDPLEVVVEGRVALVRFSMVVQDADGTETREGWAKLGLGEDLLTTWDALWTSTSAAL